MSGGAGPTTAARLLGMSTRPSRLVLAIAVAGLAATLASCSPTTSSIAPTGAIEPTPAPASDPGASDPGASDPGATPRTTQTETTWGRIWDDLPDGFPLYPGATVADDATAEPVSGVVAIAGGDPADGILEGGVQVGGVLLQDHLSAGPRGDARQSRYAP